MPTVNNRGAVPRTLRWTPFDSVRGKRDAVVACAEGPDGRHSGGK
jgi:hypothetical protein